MAEEEQDETPLERYRSMVRGLIDTQYNQWNNSILNKSDEIQRQELIDGLRGGSEVEDFVNICNFLEEYEQQQYLKGEKGSASEGTDEKTNTFRHFLIFLFSRKQVINDSGIVTNLQPINLNQVIESEKTDVEDAIRETKVELEKPRNNSTKIENLNRDKNFLEQKESDLYTLLQDNSDRTTYIQKNPILNFLISEEQRTKIVKTNLMDYSNMPESVVDIIANQYSVPTDLEPRQEIKRNKRKAAEPDDPAETAFNRRKSKKASRRKSKKASRRKSKKASIRKSKKASRRKSKKASRRKSKKASRRKSKKASRRKSKKASRRKSKKASRRKSKKASRRKSKKSR